VQDAARGWARKCLNLHVACTLQSGAAVSFVAEILGSLAFVALVGSVFVLAAALRRTGAPPESTRKAAHLGTSAVVLLLPVLIHSVVTAVALAAVAATGIAALRRARRLAFLDDVGRSAWSEYCFIAAVAVVFVAAHDDPLLFRAPILVLGISDALAAVVGTRWGHHRYTLGGATRSWEGSAAFVASAWAVLAVGVVAVSGRLTVVAGIVALLVAVVVAGVEAVSTRGRDNLTIPLATLALLVLFHAEVVS
jgi:phytol kinase